MRGSLRIGKLFGIDSFVHWTFLLVPGLALLAGLRSGGGWTLAAFSVLFVLSVFACVLLHELGHALAAKRFGIRTRDITLLPIGGIARLERMPEVPAQELWIALAGPLVNVVIAGGLFLGLALGGAASTAVPTQVTPSAFIAGVLWTNVVLVVFNLLPAFPLDGGRVLRALLALRLGRSRATEIAASLGQVIAVALGLLAVVSFHPLLFIIALFVFFAARTEAQSSRLHSAFRGVRVREAMMTDILCLQEDDPLEEAARKLLAGSQRDFPVVRQQQFKGILTRENLIRGMATHGAQAEVGTVIHRNCPTVGPDDRLEATLWKLQAGQSLPVVEGETLYGLLTAENVMEMQMLSEVTPEAHRVA